VADNWQVKKDDKTPKVQEDKITDKDFLIRELNIQNTSQTF
jgi:hypothetical protein